MRYRSQIPIALLTLLAPMLTSCTDSDDASLAPEDWKADLRSWAPGPGTELAKGVEIPADTYAVGPVTATSFSRPGVLTDPWTVSESQVMLMSSLDPLVLAESLTAHSSRGVGHRTERCEQVGPDQRSEPYLGRLKPSAEIVQCQVLIDRIDGGADIRWDVSSAQQPVLATVYGRDLPLRPTQVPAGVSGPSSVDTLEGYEDLHIIDGSFVANPPVDGAYRFPLIIGVTGDPDEVFAGYVADDPFTDLWPIDTVIDDMHVRQHRSAEAGGITRDITLNVIDGNAWIFLTVGYD